MWKFEKKTLVSRTRRACDRHWTNHWHNGLQLDLSQKSRYPRVKGQRHSYLNNVGESVRLEICQNAMVLEHPRAVDMYTQHTTQNRACFRSLNNESRLSVWCVCQVQSGSRTHLKCVNRANGIQYKDFIPRQKMVNVRVRVDFLCQLTKCPDNSALSLECG